MKKHNKVTLIVYTALMIALLVTIQAVTKSLSQFVTGSLVNLVLAVTVFICGPVSAITVALLSPFFAFVLGIGTPFLQLVPVIAAGNLVYVLLLAFLPRILKGKKLLPLVIVIAAAFKFLALYFLITKVELPTMVGAGTLPAKKADVFSASFSWPQLITALIGGFLSLGIVPTLRKAVKYE